MISEENIQKHLDDVIKTIKSYSNERNYSTTHAHKKYCEGKIREHEAVKFTLEWILEVNNEN